MNGNTTSCDISTIKEEPPTFVGPIITHDEPPTFVGPIITHDDPPIEEGLKIFICLCIQILTEDERLLYTIFLDKVMKMKKFDDKTFKIIIDLLLQKDYIQYERINKNKDIHNVIIYDLKNGWGKDYAEYRTEMYISLTNCGHEFFNENVSFEIRLNYSQGNYRNGDAQYKGNYRNGGAQYKGNYRNGGSQYKGNYRSEYCNHCGCYSQRDTHTRGVHDTRPYKIKPCSFFENGECLKGEECTFVH